MNVNVNVKTTWQTSPSTSRDWRRSNRPCASCGVRTTNSRRARLYMAKWGWTTRRNSKTTNDFPDMKGTGSPKSVIMLISMVSKHFFCSGTYAIGLYLPGTITYLPGVGFRRLSSACRLCEEAVLSCLLRKRVQLNRNRRMSNKCCRASWCCVLPLVNGRCISRDCRIQAE